MANTHSRELKNRRYEMIITNMLLAAIAFILFGILLAVANLKIVIECKPKIENPVSDAIKEADENETWG